MIGAALLSALAVATPAAAPAVCPTPPKPQPKVVYYMHQRASFGFRHDRAYVRRLVSAGRFLYDFPVTQAEARYLHRRERLALGPKVTRYLRRHPGLSAGVSIEDGWPRDAYLLLRLTEDPERYRAALEARALFPNRLRLKQVAHSTRDLRRIQDRISDDFEALDDEGLHPVDVGVDMDRNVVAVEVITARRDAAAVFRRRYGPTVRVRVLARRLTSPRCGTIYGYALGSDPASLTLSLETGGGQTFDHAVVQEGPDAVRVALIVQSPNGIQTLESHVVREVVTLAAPLGDRPVIDLRTGKPLKRYEQAAPVAP
jgi:hypothetical protein